MMNSHLVFTDRFQLLIDLFDIDYRLEHLVFITNVEIKLMLIWRT